MFGIVRCSLVGVLLCIAAAAAAGCPAVIKAPAPGGGCYTYALSAMSNSTFPIHDPYPENYLFAAPCRDADTTSCASCDGKSHGVASAYQATCSGTRCFSLDDNGLSDQATVTPNADPKTGLQLAFTGGDGGRSVVYDLTCATGKNAGPMNFSKTPSGMRYAITWPTSAACPTFDAKESCQLPTPAPTPLPKPTAPQLLYQRHEIMALIHFNMATFARNGDPGCSADNWAKNASYAAGLTNDPKTYNPAKLDTDQWMGVMKDLGAKHATITAKHGCGFLLWPTKSTLPDGSAYGYDVGHGFGRNVLKEFTESADKAGIGHGFYYSLTNNFYLNVHSHVAGKGPALPKQQLVTQSQFEEIALAQVTELWTEFGNLTEIWFDGGYTSDMKTKITALLNTYQPNTNAFGGLGVTPNALCWVGTESGNPGGEIWSTGGQNKGDPNSNVWCPKGCDTTLQNGDVWFFEKASKIRSLAELIGVYHATVGRNGMLELDFAINRDGLVEPIHAARYKELGDFVNTCYGDLKYVTSGSCTAQGCVLEIDLAKGVSPADASVTTAATGVTIDRTMIQEQLADGQRVRSYKVELITAAGATVQLSAGHSVGNKRIDVASKPVENVVKARLTVLQYVGPAVDITRFAVFAPCQSA